MNLYINKIEIEKNLKFENYLFFLTNKKIILKLLLFVFFKIYMF